MSLPPPGENIQGKVQRQRTESSFHLKQLQEIPVTLELAYSAQKHLSAHRNNTGRAVFRDKRLSKVIKSMILVAHFSL